MPIPHGSPKSGKCVVTLGMEYFYTKYYVRVWAENKVGWGPVPEPIVGMSAVKGKSLHQAECAVNLRVIFQIKLRRLKRSSWFQYIVLLHFTTLMTRLAGLH